MPTPRHVPTAETRRVVELGSGYGLRNADICAFLRIKETALRKYYRDELDHGAAVARMNIGQAVYQHAVGRPAEYDARGNMIREEMKSSPGVAVFLAKVRLRMATADRVEVKATVDVNHHQVHVDLSRLTDAEAAEFRRLYDKAKITTPASPDTTPAVAAGDGADAIRRAAIAGQP